MAFGLRPMACKRASGRRSSVGRVRAVAVPRELVQPLREVILGATVMLIIDTLSARTVRRQALEELLGQFGFDADQAPARIEIDCDRHGQLMSEILAPILYPVEGGNQAPVRARPSSQSEGPVPVQALRDFMAIVESTG
jgi:hypothetical protein